MINCRTIGLCNVLFANMTAQMKSLVSNYKITLRPNSSLSIIDTIKLVLLLAAISMSVGVGFALAGAWLVLPFAGLETLAIASAFYYILRHSGDYESIEINEDSVKIKQYQYKKYEKEINFQRYWARVNVRELKNGKRGLFIGSHGKELELGKQFLNDEQRVALAHELKQQL